MRGFTLLELVITIGLTVLVLLGLSRMFLSFDALYKYEGAAHSAQIAAGNVVRAVKDATLPANRFLSTHTFATGTYGSSASRLVVEMPSVDASGTILPSHYDYAMFYASSTDVYEVIEADAASARVSRTKLLGSDVEVLTFSYDEADPTEAHAVTLTVSASVQGGHNTATAGLTATVRARNLSP